MASMGTPCPGDECECTGKGSSAFHAALHKHSTATRTLGSAQLGAAVGHLSICCCGGFSVTTQPWQVQSKASGASEKVWPTYTDAEARVGMRCGLSGAGSPVLALPV